MFYRDRSGDRGFRPWERRVHFTNGDEVSLPADFQIAIPGYGTLSKLHTYFRDVNNNMMELLIMAYACKTSSARNIVGVIPYLPYSKQSKMRKRGCIVSKLLAQMLSKAGIEFCRFLRFLLRGIWSFIFVERAI